MIDRKALVDRNNPRLDRFDRWSPFTVGNGAFAFTADITGLQTFAPLFEETIPLGTMAEWAWHSYPMPAGCRGEKLRLQLYDAGDGRTVGYPTDPQGQETLFRYLRENPHRLHLGRIGFSFLQNGTAKIEPEDLTDCSQRLDLWSGVLYSSFRALGEMVTVATCCDPECDQVAVMVSSPLIEQGKLAVALSFPYGTHEKKTAEWASPQHHTTFVKDQEGMAEFQRRLDGFTYWAAMSFSPAARMAQTGPHDFRFLPRAEGRFCFTAAFAQGGGHKIRSFDEILARSRKSWSAFWGGGGAVSFEGSADPRAKELERRVVLSQYLTAVQSRGAMPPQETGLTFNSWYGKFHLEMHWWHSAHFALWGREKALEDTLLWYRSILPRAKQWAESQGYRGARWPKMVGPEGMDSPSPIGPLLIWQQPHLLYDCELLYRCKGPRVLRDYADLVFETAAFMASFPWYDAETGRYVLRSPLIPAQENHRPEDTRNPVLELGYWRFGLAVAGRWRERLGLPPVEKWEQVRKALSPLPVIDGCYPAHENCGETFTRFATDHPSMLGAYGMLPGDGADPVVMRRTLEKVCACWDWKQAWGWDFPLAAMTAARLRLPEQAVSLLMMETPKNTYLNNGHNYQNDSLSIYLPGNGGLLTAVALMAAGWDGCGEPLPGFPRDGSWRVEFENLRPMP